MTPLSMPTPTGFADGEGPVAKRVIGGRGEKATIHFKQIVCLLAEEGPLSHNTPEEIAARFPGQRRRPHSKSIPGAMLFSRGTVRRGPIRGVCR
jgi:hypothetical protein